MGPGSLKSCALLILSSFAALLVILGVGEGSQKSPLCLGVFSSGFPLHPALTWSGSIERRSEVEQPSSLIVFFLSSFFKFFFIF